MAIIDKEITDKYALYNGDCCEVLPDIPDASVGLSIYSPPFCGLYQYSSSPRDMSNCRSYEEFFEHYRYLVTHIERITKPGRCTAVHCMDVPFSCNAGSGLTDFPGDIIRLHQSLGFSYQTRHAIWKEPLGVRLRTMSKGLAHKQVVDDSILCDAAGADYLLIFRKKGENKEPIQHPTGLHEYAGSKRVPADRLKHKGWKGKQTENIYSHWIWRQYASAFWDDIRGCDGTDPADDSIRAKGTLPYKEAKDEEDEKHVHPLQLDVIDRVVTLRSNPNDVVLTPFMGVGSEVFVAVSMGRKGIGIELKPTYYRQAVKNVEFALKEGVQPELDLG